MIADCYFAIGKTHRICEDFAWADGLSLAVISDGCSSSHNTDWGARFLCRAAQLTWDRVGDPQVRQIIGRADYMRYGADLHPTCLDATLLVAFPELEGIEVRAWGDGVVAARQRDEPHAWDISVIHYRYGAPGYPSYLLDPDRMETFLSETSAQREILSCVLEGDKSLWASEAREGFPHEGDAFEFPRDKYDLVVLASDGVQSFQQKDGREMRTLDTLTVLRALLDFKGTGGEFVTRQVRWFLRKFCPNNGWHHNDDLAVAAIYMEE